MPRIGVLSLARNRSTQDAVVVLVNQVKTLVRDQLNLLFNSGISLLNNVQSAVRLVSVPAFDLNDPASATWTSHVVLDALLTSNLYM